MELEFNEYNFVYPHNFESKKGVIVDAKKHALANRIFKTITLEDEEKCQCCDRLIGIEGNIPFSCYNTNQLLFLGPGIPLYFLFARQSFYLLVIELLVFGIYAVFTNYLGSGCGAEKRCKQSIMNTFSIINNLQNLKQMFISTCLILGCVVINIIVLQLIRREASKLMVKADHYIDLPSNYSIMIRKLPQQYKEQDILQMIQTKRQKLNETEIILTNNLTVQKIIMSYSLRQVIETQERNIQSFKEATADNMMFQAQQNPKPSRVAPLAIVTFSMQCSKSYFIHAPSTLQKILLFFWDLYIPLSRFRVKGKRVSIEVAPEPDDIYWQNCAISYCGNIVRRFIGKIFIYLLLAIGLGIQILIKKYQASFAGEEYVQYINFSFSIAVTIFNALLAELLQFVTKKQRLSTVTEQNISLTSTLSLLQFLNSGLIVLFSNFIVDFNNFSLDGLSQSVILIMVINMFLPHLTILLWDGYNPWKRIQRWRIKTSNNIYIQKQINEAYEGADTKIALRCVYVIKTIWLTMFYGPFIPLVIPISIIGILAFYHVQKYMYSKHYKVPNMVSPTLTKQMIDLLQYSPFMLAIGTFLIYLYTEYFRIKDISFRVLIPIYLSLFISTIYAILPTDKISKKLFVFQKYEGYKPSYKEVQPNFNTDYDIANPVYHQINKKKKNNKYFKAIGQLGGLYNFLTIKKPSSQKQQFNINQPLILDPIQQAQIQMMNFQKPLMQNHQNIFNSYISTKRQCSNRKQSQQILKHKPESSSQKSSSKQSNPMIVRVRQPSIQFNNSINQCNNFYQQTNYLHPGFISTMLVDNLMSPFSPIRNSNNPYGNISSNQTFY